MFWLVSVNACTLLSLIFIPVVFTLMDDIQRRIVPLLRRMLTVEAGQPRPRQAAE